MCAKEYAIYITICWHLAYTCTLNIDFSIYFEILTYTWPFRAAWWRGVSFSLSTQLIFTFRRLLQIEKYITYQRLTHGEVCKSSMSFCSHTVIRYRSIGTIYNIYNNYRINAVQSHFDMLHFEKHTSIYSFTYHDRLRKWIACMVSY